MQTANLKNTFIAYSWYLATVSIFIIIFLALITSKGIGILHTRAVFRF